MAFIRVLIFLGYCLLVTGQGMQPQFILTICGVPPNFPAAIALSQHKYMNWAQEIIVPHQLVATPRSSEEVVLLANWASDAGYKLRPVGFSHTWAPTTITPDTAPCPKLILVFTLPHLNKVSLVSKDGATGVIRAEGGASLLKLLTFAEQEGLGFHNHPASGDHSVGGILAIGGHGAGTTPVGSSLPDGFAMGTVSNLILSVTVVAWDTETSAYALRTFIRDEDEDAPAFFTHLGRTFVAEVTLRAGPLRNLRCESFTNILMSELVASPEDADANHDLTTVSSLMDNAAAFEIILFAFTEKPWLKVWTTEPTRPLTSRPVSTPFNYPFSYIIPGAVSAIVDQVNGGIPEAGAGLGQVFYALSSLGLDATFSRDIWGPAKNVLLFVLPTTLRTTNAGFCILTKRQNVQLISHTIYTFYSDLLISYAILGEFPINVAFELRVSGLDDAGQVGAIGGLPWLSGATPSSSHPEYDTAIWPEVLALPSTPGHTEFMMEFEQFLLSTYSPASEIGLARPEWSKGWAYTKQTGWNNTTILNQIYPVLFQQMDKAKEVYAKYDPESIFTNDFLKQFI